MHPWSTSAKVDDKNQKYFFYHLRPLRKLFPLQYVHWPPISICICLLPKLNVKHKIANWDQLSAMELKATIQRSRWKANFASWKRARKEAKFLVMAPPTLDDAMPLLTSGLIFNLESLRPELISGLLKKIFTPCFWLRSCPRGFR